MNKQKFLLSLLLFCLHSLCVQAQENFPQFKPPSPGAYELGKYGDIPVSLYTGVPNITIPLSTLVDNDLTIDVSLSYHGSGIKVDEVAPWTGLGWSLNSGGVITRVVNGRAEYLASDGTLKPQRSDIDFYTPQNYSSIANFIYSNNLEAAATDQIDNAPDEYYFNFCGRSGTFYFDKDGNALLNKHEALKIRLEYVDANKFNIIITAENGVVYEFRDYEWTNYGGVNGSAISSWYLSKIKSPKGGEIDFEYQQLPNVHNPVRSLEKQIVDTRIPHIAPFVYPADGLSVSELRVKKISTENGYIEITTNSVPREDCPSATYAIDEIIVYRIDGTPIHRFKFYTNYFEANNSRKYDGPNVGNYGYLNYRLRLDSIQEFSGDNNKSKPVYRFVYLGDDDPATNDPYTLPYRLSPSQDHWGYYNNASNEHMFPGNPDHQMIGPDEFYKFFAPNWQDIYTDISLTNGSNREPNAEAMKAGLLHEVYYPTGGHTEFIFEPNVIGYPNQIGSGTRIKEVKNYSGTTLVSTTKYKYSIGTLTYNPKNYYYKYYRVLYIHNGSPGQSIRPEMTDESLAAFDLPITGNTDAFLGINYIKITATPQAVLGCNGSHVHYDAITVSNEGNGYTEYKYDNMFTDYTSHEGLETDEIMKLGDLYRAAYATANQYPIAPPYPGPSGMFGDRYIGFSDWPYPSLYSNEWKRGVLSSKLTYSQDSILLKEEHYTYTRELLTSVAGYRVVKVSSRPDYVYVKYFYPHAWIRPKDYTLTLYNSDGSNHVTTVTNYYYDNIDHAQLTRKTITQSNGDQETTTFTYPQDFASGTLFIDQMKDHHLVNYPVEQTQYIHSGSTYSIKSGSIIQYHLGGNGLDEETWALESPGTLPLSSFKFSNRLIGVLPPAGDSTVFLKDAHYKLNAQYDQYGSSGNLLQATLRGGMTKSYLWDYHESYPIAEAINASQPDIAYCSFEADSKGNWSFIGTPSATGGFLTGSKSYPLSSGALSKSGLTSSKKYIISYWLKSGGSLSISGGTQSNAITGKTINGWTCHAVTISGATSVSLSGSGYIDELRLYPAHAQMTTYTYNPLIGMTSQCDARNNITYYDYDGFGRLRRIKDEDGKILKQYDYQYQAPVTQ